MSDNQSYGTPFLSSQCLELKEEIYRYGIKITSDAHVILIHPYEAVDSIYYIDKGRVRFCTTNYEGKEKILLIQEEGSIFGAVPSLLILQMPNMSIVTETPTVLYKMDNRIIASSNLLKDGLLKYMSKTIMTLMKVIESLSLDCCKIRLYNLFCASADAASALEDNWYSLRFQYSQDDMAKIISANRVTVARLINELCDEELIRIVNRKIQVKKTAD
ncbi:MAG: hypothetical protein APF84_13990 [Gracilibacter sp. BRH_c7a]|nr:MAG: hypothetical protein APF84_13990 [Gracilibacter sp. BRH_c7a]